MQFLKLSYKMQNPDIKDKKGQGHSSIAFIHIEF